MLIIGGSLRYPGAALLASRAALRCGAGVVTIAAARTVVEAIAGEDPNVTLFPLAEAQAGVVAASAAAQVSTITNERTRALLVGPGLAHAPGTDDFVIATLRNARSITTVIDADGLNALSRTEAWRDAAQDQYDEARETGRGKPATPEVMGPPIVYLAAQTGDTLTGRILHHNEFGKSWP